MPLSAVCDFTAVGGNRHPAAADWDPISGCIAFGADWNVALWNPAVSPDRDIFDQDQTETGKQGPRSGVHALLSGHTDQVTAVKFIHSPPAKAHVLLTGSVDQTIRVWRQRDHGSSKDYVTDVVLDHHGGSINVFAINSALGVFASGSADKTVKIWKLDVSPDTDELEVLLVQSILPKVQFIPLALALHPLNADTGSWILAAAGTKNIIQIYIASHSTTSMEFRIQSSLTGHDGWIRSLAWIQDPAVDDPDLLLASASQDKYIRLWRIHQGEELPAANAVNTEPLLGSLGSSLSNKAHRFHADGLAYSITFEALLLGHDDWIYTATWRPGQRGLQLLSASADNSLAIWEPDQTTGIWICVARLGEISGQKGSTTATGSTGGFWIGLWSPDGETVVSLGRSGSWRLWRRDQETDRWLQKVAVTGHVKEITAMAWAKNGQYLLSTGSVLPAHL